MKIIFGLGNPGKEYAKSRHNTGFMAIDALATKLGAEWKQDPKFKSEIASARRGNEQMFLVKPQTMMNLSGEAVVAVSNFYKADSDEITIIYDDLDLPLGEIRERDKGSAGTHNGMKSVIQLMGTEDIKRFRIGIESRGTTSPAEQDTTSYVLSNFSKEEKVKIDEAIQKLVDILVKPYK